MLGERRGRGDSGGGGVGGALASVFSSVAESLFIRRVTEHREEKRVTEEEGKRRKRDGVHLPPRFLCEPHDIIQSHF